MNEEEPNLNFQELLVRTTYACIIEFHCFVAKLSVIIASPALSVCIVLTHHTLYNAERDHCSVSLPLLCKN